MLEKIFQSKYHFILEVCSSTFEYADILIIKNNGYSSKMFDIDNNSNC